MNKYFVYIMSNWSHSVVYVGVTNDLKRRCHEHKTGVHDGFTKRYNVNKLVYFFETKDIKYAISLEKRIKGWTRSKKNVLINKFNPEWKDLSEIF